MKHFKLLNGFEELTTLDNPLELDFERIAVQTYDIAVPTRENPAFYDTDDFTFVGVSPIHIEPYTYVSYRSMIYRNNRDYTLLTGESITEEHPMWNIGRIQR